MHDSALGLHLPAGGSACASLFFGIFSDGGFGSGLLLQITKLEPLAHPTILHCGWADVQVCIATKCNHFSVLFVFGTWATSFST